MFVITGIGIGSGAGLLVSSDGHLLISEARLQHSGNYTCVAENTAAKRLSDIAIITVYGKNLFSKFFICSFPTKSGCLDSTQARQAL